MAEFCPASWDLKFQLWVHRDKQWSLLEFFDTWQQAWDRGNEETTKDEAMTFHVVKCKVYF